MDNGGILCRSLDRCECCGTSGTVIYNDLKDSIFSAAGIWSIRQCGNAKCDLAWIDPQPDAAHIAKLYDGYWTHGDADGNPPAPNPECSGGKAKFVKDLVARIVFWRKAALQSDNRYLAGRPAGKLLDIGCGMGEFAAGMAELGWDASGIDFDDAAVSVAQRQPGITVRAGSLESQDYASNSFDAITMSNVIEHLPDPRAAFMECHRILRKDGRLVMITPNIQALGHRTFGADWRGLETPRHLFLFSQDAFKRFAKDANFSRVQTFTTAGAADMMFAASEQIAAARGRSIARPTRLAIWRQKLAVLLGTSEGEWVVLLADK